MGSLRRVQQLENNSQLCSIAGTHVLVIFAEIEVLPIHTVIVYHITVTLLIKVPILCVSRKINVENEKLFIVIWT